MEIPLVILWKNTCHFYGRFEVLIGYKEKIEKIGTIEGMKGQLFVYDDFCYFGVPNVLKASGQYSILYRFDMNEMKIEKSTVNAINTLILKVPNSQDFCIV